MAFWGWKQAVGFSAEKVETKNRPRAGLLPIEYLLPEVMIFEAQILHVACVQSGHEWSCLQLVPKFFHPNYQYFNNEKTTRVSITGHFRLHDRRAH